MRKPTIEQISEIDFSSIRDTIFEQIQGDTGFDIKHIKDTQDPGWDEDSKKIQKRLFNAALLPMEMAANAEDTALVSYTYPKESELGSCLFFTNRTMDGHMLLGLPGSSTESLGDRPYWGIVVYKNGRVEMKVSYGNRLFKGITKELSELDQAEARFIIAILESWETK